MREKLKKRIPLFAAFLLPLLISIIICVDHEVYPFGEQCILHIDMYHQYCPFFTELLEKIKTGGSFLYSWNIGLGADFVSLYAYYLASPLNWLIAFCPSGSVIEFMTILVLLKTAFCGLTFAYYLREHFKTDHFAVSIFGTAYALSAFMAVYAWNIMWTDCMVLAPLVVLGLERLIKEGKPVLYFVALSVCILSNYYISIMICIFLVFWFFICWAENRETGVGAWIRFAIYSLLAGGMGAVLIFPTAIILGYSGAQGISFPETMEWYFQILPELARHCILTEPYTGTEHWPSLYCGVFVLVLFVLYLLNRKISWKHKMPYVLFLVLFVLSFSNNILDFIWHGLHFPTSLPGRQSFLYIFLLLSVSFEAFLCLRGNKIWHVVLAGAADVLFLLAAYHWTDTELVSNEAFTVTAILVQCYLVAAAGYLAGTEKVKKMMLWVGGLCVLAELAINYDFTGLDTTSRTSYMKNYEQYASVLAAGKTDAAADGVGFYRVEELERKSKNDAALYGYPSATQFSSLMNLNVSHFYQDVGMEGGKNFYCINGATPLLSAMLSLRYVIADNPLEAGSLRTLSASDGGVHLYENKYVLPLGFMMKEDVIQDWDYQDMGDIAAQNNLAYLLGADQEMLSVVPSESEAGESTVFIEKDGYYYATYDKTSITNLTLEVSDGRTRSYTKVSHGYTLELGYCTAGSVVKIKNNIDEKLNITAYYLNEDAVDAAYHTLNRQTMELLSFDDTKIKGVIDVAEAGRLIFSIANEDGWTLFVDGVETEKETFAEAFISVSLTEGVHEIELRYQTPGLVQGAAVSGGSLLMFFIVMFVRKKLIERQKEV